MVSYLEISSVVLIPVSLRTLLQGDEYEPSEVGGAGCSQSHWVEANISDVNVDLINSQPE